jgi:ubiquinone/menaquinone biosynthesis C-methylase UbiE
MRGSVPKNLLSLWDLLCELPAGAKILDLGCGAGSFDYTSFPQLEIHALDERIDEKVKSFPSHVRFKAGVASAIPEQDSSFDLVVANFVFEHFPDGAGALREIDRVTRDGGYVWISTNNAGSFEDQLYRNLFAGGGHLQQPTFERFLRQTYENTSLKMIAYSELPAAFTYLGESEELRHLTWALVDSLRRTVGVDARIHSGWVFVLQKLSSLGPGFREYLRSCPKCGSPDETVAPGSTGESINTFWVCSKCGERNCNPSSIQAVSIDDVERGLRLQWERYPETRPQRLKELLEEKARWGKELERLLDEARENFITLKAEFDERGRWAQELDKEIHAQREYIEKLKEDARLPTERRIRLLNQLWRRFRGIT